MERTAASVAGVLSDDIAIDLGTANTLVHVAGRGVVIDEPSVVAVRMHGAAREVLAVGAQAKAMLGRAPESIEIIRPLRDGVIADFVAAEEMLRQFIRRATPRYGFRRPRILVCVPAGATPVERRAVYDTALEAGGRKAYLIEEPVAAALGAGLPIDEPTARMVIDIGGGTTDIAVMSSGGVVMARSVRCAGNAMDEAIIRHVRRRHQLHIGEASAERMKIDAGTAVAMPGVDAPQVHIRGRDLQHGRAKSILLGPDDIAEALEVPIETIAEFVMRAIEDLSPDVAADICEHGLKLTGGGALLAQLDAELARRIGLGVTVLDEPLQCVVKGAAAALASLQSRANLLVGA